MSYVFSVQAVAARMVSFQDNTTSPFPRDIELAALDLPLHVELIEGLTPARIEFWLHGQLDWPRERQTDHRRLRGCLVAHRGCAFVFLEAEETVNERRVTLAHELAHFIGHYVAARQFAIARLGDTITDVLDGIRAPSPAERLSGTLARCPLGVFRDVIEREGSVPLTPLAERMEGEADAAAFAALAPPAEVLAKCTALGFRPVRATVLAILQEHFGLAKADAVHHVPAVLQRVRRQAPTLVESLRAAAVTSEADVEQSK